MNLIQHFVNGKITPGKSDKKGKILHSWSKVKVKEHVDEVITFIKENKL